MQSGFSLSRFQLFTAERPSLDQFILLSLMLHVLVIALFGDTSGGGARRGEKLWGALTVTVQGMMPERGIGLTLDRGATLLQQSDAPRLPLPSTGTNPENLDRRAATTDAAAVEVPAPPTLAPSFEMPSLISKDIDKPVTDFVVPKRSVDRAYVPPSLEPSAEQLARDTQVVSPPVIAPPVIDTPKPLPVVPQKVERATVAPLPIIKPVEAILREEPTPVPVTAPRAEPPLPAVEREVAKPAIEVTEPRPREIVPPVIQPVPASSTIPAATAVAPPPKLERESAPVIAPPVEPKLREIPVAVPASARGETPKAQPDIPAQAAPSAATTAPPLPPSTRAPAGTPSGANDLLKPRGESSTPSVDVPALAPASGKTPGFDLDAMRKRAREIDRGGGPRALFPFPVAPPQKPKTREQQAFDKALKKNDCRDAYADIGLAAVVPLVIDAVREGGCKW